MCIRDSTKTIYLHLVHLPPPVSCTITWEHRFLMHKKRLGHTLLVPHRHTTEEHQDAHVGRYHTRHYRLTFLSLQRPSTRRRRARNIVRLFVKKEPAICTNKTSFVARSHGEDPAVPPQRDESCRMDTREKASTASQIGCLLYTSPSPRDRTRSRMPSSA